MAMMSNEAGFFLMVLAIIFGYACYWEVKLITLIVQISKSLKKEKSMGPTYTGQPPCWKDPGCLHCWLFCECYCGVSRHSKSKKCHPINKQKAREAAESLSSGQLVAMFRQRQHWPRTRKRWAVPEPDQCGKLYTGVQFICEDCYMLDLDCKERAAKRYRKHLKKLEKLKKKGEAVANKRGEANLEKAKSRFRGAAWWFFGAVLGLISGKFFVDAALYFGMPAVPGAGPMKVWTITMWTVLIGGYICLFGAFWMGLSIIRRKFKLKTSYDVTMGDVRIVKVDPELAKNLLPYESAEETKRIEMADATAEVMASAQAKEAGDG